MTKYYQQTKNIDGVWHQYCYKCGIELESHQVGLINFTQMSHIPKGSNNRSVCPIDLLSQCPYCGRDLD